MKLCIVRESAEILAAQLSGNPIDVGRRPDNGLTVEDSTVSWLHASFWIEAGRAFVRDHASRNGTFINEARITGMQELQPDDRIRLGANTDLVVRGRPGPGGGHASMMVVQDVHSGVSYSAVHGRCYIGSGENCSIQVDGAGEHEMLLSFHPDGEIWLSSFEAESALELGQVFAVGPRSFRVVRASVTPSATVVVNVVQFEYRLVVTLDGVTGPEATIEDPATGMRHTIAAENRAVLLYVLARRNVEARARGTDPLSEEAWCSDDEVARDIWGKKGTADANSLHVLVHRLRKEIKKAGFDPWFIEKRRRAIRIALRDVIVG